MNAAELVERIDDLNGQIAGLIALRDAAVQDLKELNGERYETVFMGWIIVVKYSESGSNWHFAARTAGSGTYGGGCPTRREAIEMAKRIVEEKNGVVIVSNAKLAERKARLESNRR